MHSATAAWLPSFPYDTLTWTGWILLAFCAAWWRRWRGIFFGQLGVGATILMLNLRWLHDAMSQPGWRGTPNLDSGFVLGLMLHVILINGILVPVSVAGLLLGLRKRTPPENFQDPTISTPPPYPTQEPPLPRK
jgi:hypothetical protein